MARTYRCAWMFGHPYPHRDILTAVALGLAIVATVVVPSILSSIERSIPCRTIASALRQVITRDVPRDQNYKST